MDAKEFGLLTEQRPSSAPSKTPTSEIGAGALKTDASVRKIGAGARKIGAGARKIGAGARKIG